MSRRSSTDRGIQSLLSLAAAETHRPSRNIATTTSACVDYPSSDRYQRMVKHKAGSMIARCVLKSQGSLSKKLQSWGTILFNSSSYGTYLLNLPARIPVPTLGVLEPFVREAPLYATRFFALHGTR